MRRLSGDGEGVPQARKESILGELEFAVVAPHRELPVGGWVDGPAWFPHSPQDNLFGGGCQADFRSLLVAKVPLRDESPASSRLRPSGRSPAGDRGSRSFREVRAEAGTSARAEEGCGAAEEASPRGSSRE